MQYVIPMSGLGSRFVAAGYARPKPLIEVMGRPMIAWVLDILPAADEVVFICRKEHLETTEMRAILTALRPDAQIVAYDQKKTTGPVPPTLAAKDYLAKQGPIVVGYCDYYMQWDSKAFLTEAQLRGCDGAVPCYTGFHPHLLIPKNVYAGCRVDGDGNLLEIREKHCFTPNKMEGLHSPGLYYFKNRDILLSYSERLMQEGPDINGEFYTSMVYVPMLADGLQVWAPGIIDRFCQWGTPEDLQEFKFWLRQGAVQAQQPQRKLA